MVYQVNKWFGTVWGLSGIILSAVWVINGEPLEKSVRVIYLQPSDVTDNIRYQDGIAKVLYDAQNYFLEQCGYTFRLNKPVCEVLKGEHIAEWYEKNDVGGDSYWRTITNMRNEIERRMSDIFEDSSRKRWKVVAYVNAAGNGGGGGGWVVLPKHDADGAAGYPAETARWVGGMCHELGHLWGLPDASSTDGTVMSASFYGWPNCIFNDGHIKSMKNSSANNGFWITDISGIAGGTVMNRSAEDIKDLSWYLHDGQLHIRSEISDLRSSLLSIFDLTGKRTVCYGSSRDGPDGITDIFDVHHLNPGTYICTIRKGWITSHGKIIIGNSHK